MDTTQQNGGTAGLVAALFLALLLVLAMSTGLDPQHAATPSDTLRAIARKPTLWSATGIIGAAVAAFGIMFAVGLSNRLRSQAPTSASAMLYFAVVGLGAYALFSLMQWRGGIQLANYFSTQSEDAAVYAWLAFRAVISGLRALGAAFAGASMIIGGWAVISTNLLNPIAGWAGVIAGLLSIVGLFAPNSSGLFLGSIVFAIIWLAWAGVGLRRTQRA